MTKRIISLLYDEVEDLEFWYPTLRLREAGATVDVAGEERGKTYHGKYGLPAEAEISFKDAKVEEYDGILVPGGWAPDKLRRDRDILQLVQNMNAQGKILGFICHAGWVAASAGICKGKRVTGSTGIKDDLENAGAIWVDKPALREGNLVWGRVVADIPDYCRELIKAFS